MKKAMMVIIFGIMLLIPSYSGALISDPEPTNMAYGLGIYEHRDDGYWGVVTGTGYRSGDYYYLQSQIVLGGLLASFDDIISVKAFHWPQGSFPLIESRSSWLDDPEVSFWALRMRPSSWVFEGNWRFIFRYTGTDGEEHKQVLIFPAQPVAFPPPVSHVEITKSADAFVISWSGIGDPSAQGNIDYRVLILESAPPNDWIQDVRGNWSGGGTLVSGTYDPAFNRVIFVIPKQYGREDYVIRIGQRVGVWPYQGRAVYYLVLPEF